MNLLSLSPLSLLLIGGGGGLEGVNHQIGLLFPGRHLTQQNKIPLKLLESLFFTMIIIFFFLHSSSFVRLGLAGFSRAARLSSLATSSMIYVMSAQVVGWSVRL